MPAIDMPVALVSFILILTLIFLISEKISVDKTAVGIMVLLALTGILTPAETVAGFANPAVITVGAMFLLCRGLIRTGAVSFLTELVLKFSKGNRQYAFIIILAGVAVLSAFINNTPVVVLFIPIVMGLSCECDFSPSKLLMPGRTAPVCELDEGKEEKYIAELMVTKESPLIGEKDINSYAISTAVSLGVDTRPFIIGICFGASACYASPIGYQTNLLVYGPGGYRFSDFIKLGLPLNILVIVLASLFIPVFWPF